MPDDDITADDTATETVDDVTSSTEPEERPAETVEFWKSKAREQEKRAKSNVAAAKRLAELEDAQKSDAEKVADRIAKAEAEVTALPAKVAAGLRDHLIALHQIGADDAELFLTAQDPDLILKQVARLVGRSGSSRTKSVSREGSNPDAVDSEMSSFTAELFGSAHN